MKELQFKYQMDVSFSNEIKKHSFTLKCIPHSNPKQKIRITKQEISPLTWSREGMDSFGNQYLYGMSERRHYQFSVLVEGEAVVDRNNREEETEDAWRLLKYPTALTECKEELQVLSEKYRADFEKDGVHFADHLNRLMKEIYEWMAYTPGSTTLNTDAYAAYVQKAGVCQDYAHIMLAVLRNLQIPCMYIAGFMLGEGASHAWVNILDANTGISYEIDPTNCRFVDDGYIEVSRGRDAHDCKMNKGIYHGFTRETQRVTVVVKGKE